MGDVIDLIKFREKTHEDKTRAVLEFMAAFDELITEGLLSNPENHELILCSVCKRLSDYTDLYQGDKYKLLKCYERFFQKII